MSDFNEYTPTISTSSLSRIREAIGHLDRSGNLLSLATKEVADLLRTIDRENENWTVLTALEGE